MSEAPLDFQGLGEALQVAENIRDRSLRGALQERYRAEIALLMIGLSNAGIAAGRNDRPLDPAAACDVCGVELEKDALYVDGRVLRGGGMWANMCMTCYLEQGSGIGWGVGQLYRHDGLGWQCIAGGNPTPPEDDEQL